MGRNLTGKQEYEVKKHKKKFAKILQVVHPKSKSIASKKNQIKIVDYSLHIPKILTSGHTRQSRDPNEHFTLYGL